MKNLNYAEAIEYVDNTGGKICRAKWQWGHVTKIKNPSCKFNGKLVRGSVINGYHVYEPTEEDINTNDWFIMEG